MKKSGLLIKRGREGKGSNRKAEGEKGSEEDKRARKNANKSNDSKKN